LVRDNLVLAHLLVDIANFEHIFKRFLGKKKMDIMNHPYFKKFMNESSPEKLKENLENKLKLFEF
jgi:hypothetical protein